MCAFSMVEMEKQVFAIYESLNVTMTAAGVQSGGDLNDGWKATDQNGELLLRSPFEMGFVAHCVQQVCLFFDQSRSLPDAEVLRSWLESLDVSQEECITTVWCLVQTMAWRLSITRGDGDSVLRMLESINAVEEQKDTAQNTSSKIKEKNSSGKSSGARSRGKGSGGRTRKKKTRRKKNPSGTRNPDDPGSNSLPTRDIGELDAILDQK